MYIQETFQCLKNICFLKINVTLYLLFQKKLWYQKKKVKNTDNIRFTDGVLIFNINSFKILLLRKKKLFAF